MSSFDDLLAVANAWRAHDAPTIARLGVTLGLELALSDLAALEAEMCELHHLDIVRALSDAVEAGLGTATATQRMRVVAGRREHVHCLAVRTDSHVVVALKHVRTTRANFVSAWPELGTWSRIRGGNLERARRWANGDSDGKVRIRLTVPAAMGRARDPAALLAMLAEHPDDRATRDVLGDLWAEAGDPRGELIALERELEGTADRVRVVELVELRNRIEGLWAEAGDPPGELIALEHELEGTADRVCAVELRNRIERLAHANAATIAGDIALHATTYSADTWHVRSVTMSAARFRDYGEALFRAHPVEWLEIAPCNAAALRTLAATLHLELVRGLKLFHNAKPMLALRDRRLPRLRGLEITGDGGGLQQAADVASELSSLTMFGGTLDPSAVEVLARGPWCRTLEHLRVYPDQRARAAAAPHPELAWPRLRTAEVRAWFADDAWVAALMRQAPNLSSLWVASIGMEQLARTAELCPELVSLACDRATPGPVELAALLALPHLRELYLVGVASGEVASLLETVRALPDTHPLERGRIGPHAFDRTAR